MRTEHKEHLVGIAMVAVPVIFFLIGANVLYHIVTVGLYAIFYGHLKAIK